MGGCGGGRPSVCAGEETPGRSGGGVRTEHPHPQPPLPMGEGAQAAETAPDHEAGRRREAALVGGAAAPGQRGTHRRCGWRAVGSHGRGPAGPPRLRGDTHHPPRRPGVRFRRRSRRRRGPAAVGVGTSPRPDAALVPSAKARAQHRCWRDAGHEHGTYQAEASGACDVNRHRLLSGCTKSSSPPLPSGEGVGG
mgnify:CR=1 FL=1